MPSKLLDGGFDLDSVADLHARRSFGEYEDRIGRLVVAVIGGLLKVKASAFNGRNDALGADALTNMGSSVAEPLNLRDGSMGPTQCGVSGIR